MRHQPIAIVLGLFIALSACGEATPFPTQTATVTNTPAIVVQVTHFPTTVAAPSATPKARPTITSTPTHTPTYTPAPPTIAPTLGPSPTTLIAAPPGTLIKSFTAEPVEINPGEPFTLSWKVASGQATLWNIFPSGQLGLSETVALEGSKQVSTRPSDRNFVHHMLYVQDGSLSESRTVTVRLTCPDTWFMANPPTTCPASSALVTQGVYQVFQNGLMIWLQGNGYIFVLHSDGNSPQWEMFPDTWEAGMPEKDDLLVAPAGLIQPVRGFGKVWREQHGVKDRLSWALEGEVVFSSAYQCDSSPKYSRCFVQGPDGVILLQPERSGWALWAGPTPAP